MKKVIAITTALLVVLLFSFCAAQKGKDTPNMKNYGTGDYDAIWKTIDSLEYQGLPKSAQEELEKLYAQVKDTDDPTTIWRCLIYRSKYVSQLEEDGFIKSLQNLEAELAEASFPLQPLLQSTLAELYNRYLNTNYWQIRERSERGQFDPTFDIATWSPGQLIDRARSLYLASVENPESRQVPIENLDQITSQPINTDVLRPTMFDFLAFRAIDYFSNSQTFLTEPVYKFYLRQTEAFADVNTFVNYKFETQDSTSSIFRALLLYQNLLRQHQADTKPAALIDANLKRLQFAQQHSTLGNKEELYLERLLKLSERNRGNVAYSEICAAIAKVYQGRGKSYQPNPDNKGKMDLVKAKEYCEKGIEAYPDSFGAEQCRAIQSSIEQKGLQFKTELVTSPNLAFPSQLTYRNLSEVYLKVAPMSENQWEKYQKLRWEDQLNFLNKLDPIKNWKVDLPVEKDYQEHSVEVKIDPLALGRYVILAADNDGFREKKGGVNFLFIQVSQLSYVQRSLAGKGQEFFVVDRESGAPVAGASVQSYIQSRNKNRNWNWEPAQLVKTNAEGYALLSNIKEGSSYKAIISKGDDVLNLDNSRFRNYRNYPNPKQVNTQFFLDRKIYRPGQTVYFKALVLEKNENYIPKVLANQTVSISFYDANYQVVATKELTTNEFGTVHGSFTAPRIGLLGTMTIQSSMSGSISFNVEEYKRPKFEVTFEDLTESYKLGDPVLVKGKAKAYAGSSIDGAKVQYRVIRRVSYPYFPWWRWSYWRPQRPEMEIANGTAKTDANGDFEITFEAQADPGTNVEYQPQFDFSVIADVIDITGETRTGETNVSVGYIALKADIAIGDKLERNGFDSLQISTKNLNGGFEAASGKVTVARLQNPDRIFRKRRWKTPDQFLYTKAEYYEYFPQDAYSDEHLVEKYPVAEQVEALTFNTAQAKAIALDASKYTVGWYLLTFQTQDKYGTPIELKKYFQVFDLKRGAIAKGNLDFVHQNQSTYAVGDKAQMYFGTSYPQQKVLFELEHQGKTLRRSWLNADKLLQESQAIVEQYRGNVHYSFMYVHANRIYGKEQTLVVPWSNKDLQIEYATFRDKLYPGAAEKWQIKISGAKKDRVAAEVLAAMYDASLDAFAPNNWYLNLHPTYNRNLTFRAMGFGISNAQFRNEGWNTWYSPVQERRYRSLNWFSFYDAGGNNRRLSRMRGVESDAMLSAVPAPMMEKAEMSVAANEMAADVVSEEEVDTEGGFTGDLDPPKEPAAETDLGQVQVRTNLKETVFFFPDLKTDADGNVIIEFTMNEALTRWKFLLLAHTKDLETVTSQKEVVTQKELMVMPNAPRFLREGDTIEFTAKVSNLSEGELNGTARLELFDALSMQAVDAAFGNTQSAIEFTAAEGQSAVLSWKLTIPTGQAQAIVHRVVAQAKTPDGSTFSDGEEDGLPVLINRMLVTESLPLPVRGNQSKDFVFTRMQEVGKSNTMQHHRLTLEYTSNPAWYAVQALPYLMEYPYDCTEQIFNRFYANSLATSVANAHPKIRQVFDSWKNSDALMSNLSKNQELKSAILEETPWVLDAQSEEQQKKNIGLLFDLNRMSEEQASALEKIVERQEYDGGFSWFPGGRSNWYITQYLVEGIGHLQQLGVTFNTDQNKLNDLTTKAIGFIDQALVERYKRLEQQIKRNKGDWKANHLSNIEIHYLYTRSFYPDIALSKATQEARDFFMGQAKDHWLKAGLQQQALICLALHRDGEKATADQIIRSLKERALQNEELGMYWKMQRGYYWYEHPIETQALLIEAFREVAQDKEAVEEMRIWLLKNKQTSNWKTTKATAAAVYALLIDDTKGQIGGWLLNDKLVEIKVGNKKVEANPADVQAGTGYFKTSWRGSEITEEMAQVKVENPNDVIAWGGLYWQYFEQLDKITSFEETPLQLNKTLYLEKASDRGPVLEALAAGAVLEPGDKLKVRIELRVDRDMEFIHLKDMRGSGFEPLNVLSQYKWQDGLGYYESTRDVSTNFFMDNLPKGTYVFEYPLRVVHKGNFSNGISSIQCMYAPEFSSHSEGLRVEVK